MCSKRRCVPNFTKEPNAADDTTELAEAAGQPKEAGGCGEAGSRLKDVDLMVAAMEGLDEKAGTYVFPNSEFERILF